MSGMNNPVVGTCSVAIATKMPWNDEGYCPPQVYMWGGMELRSRTVAHRSSASTTPSER